MGRPDGPFSRSPGRPTASGRSSAAIFLPPRPRGFARRTEPLHLGQRYRVFPLDSPRQREIRGSGASANRTHVSDEHLAPEPLSSGVWSRRLPGRSLLPSRPQQARELAVTLSLALRGPMARTLGRTQRAFDDEAATDTPLRPYKDTGCLGPRKDEPARARSGRRIYRRRGSLENQNTHVPGTGFSEPVPGTSAPFAANEALGEL